MNEGKISHLLNRMPLGVLEGVVIVLFLIDPFAGLIFDAFSEIYDAVTHKIAADVSVMELWAKLTGKTIGGLMYFLLKVWVLGYVIRRMIHERRAYKATKKQQEMINENF